MKSVDKILQIVKRDGSVTAKHLSSELNMTSMGARQHLQALQDDGLLSINDIKVKVGRPTRHWSLTQKGHEQFADCHGELTIQFIDVVEQVFGKEGLNKVVHEREKRTLHSYQQHLKDCATLADKLKALVLLREQEGYMAELEQDSEGFILIENHCPICKAATRCPSLCQSELNVFQTLLGKETRIERTEHIIHGQRRCVYRIFT
ncbi:helix-turn-helix transcriptional regulator [Vibrio sagamiensis]|uniref:Transcriptional regulator n=1 Tax=Vibrio sagamiensis NBRC 104589 TaxID=1219064 RepID=A0A511QFL0_9VIBR|nr:metalloregulator ArsR/SmtB family transcription factor [Vibrio sagamiensis]PNQ66241.1 transcriptional regulator [Vibrio agarivorans]GEM76084.1 transcriptional regulator [Vibrio sagamiensis NBRC 104589]